MPEINIVIKSIIKILKAFFAIRRSEKVDVAFHLLIASVLRTILLQNNQLCLLSMILQKNIKK